MVNSPNIEAKRREIDELNAKVGSLRYEIELERWETAFRDDLLYSAYLQFVKNTGYIIVVKSYDSIPHEMYYVRKDQFVQDVYNSEISKSGLIRMYDEKYLHNGRLWPQIIPKLKFEFPIFENQNDQ